MKKLLIIFALFTISLLPQKRPFTLDDIYNVKSVSAPILSPDGNKIAFTATTFNLKEGKSKSKIYIMNNDGSNQYELLNEEKSVYSPFWSNDSREIYFMFDGKLFKSDLLGSEKKEVLDFYTGINESILSPDGKYILFSSEVYPECGADNDCNQKIAESIQNGPIKAYMSDTLLFRHWNFYHNGTYSHLFIQELETGKITDITPGDFHSPVFSVSGGGFTFSPNSKEICFVSNRDKEQASSTNADLWLVSLGGEELQNITFNNKAWDGSPSYSPDGKFIAYRCQLKPGYESDKFRLAIYDVVNKKSEIISESFDNWIEDFQWSNDGKFIYFLADEKSYSPLFKINVKTKETEKIIADRSIGGFTVSPDGKYVYYSYRLMDKPSEIYKYDLKTKKETQLTFFNKTLLDEVAFQPAVHYWIKGADNKLIHNLVVFPHDFDKTKKYPVVFNIHGGPQSQWMDAYRGDAQLYAGYGYITVFPNPHGSTGYGQDFTLAISRDWGGKVFQDVMMITDSISKLPFVDKDRIGAMGWSYGGYMMNWLQGQTKIFKCFVSMMGIYNLESFYGTTEELWFPEWDLGGASWETDDYKKFSPIEYVNNFSTPTLIITGEKDYRVSYTQSLEYFTALQKKGIDSRIIIFPNDGHWPSHIKSMPLYYNAHLEWFNKYLGGKPAPYDSWKMIKNIGY